MATDLDGPMGPMWWRGRWGGDGGGAEARSAQEHCLALDPALVNVLPPHLSQLSSTWIGHLPQNKAVEDQRAVVRGHPAI